MAIEHQVGRLLDVGVILPRLRQVYDWWATELGQPGVLRMARGRQGAAVPSTHDPGTVGASAAPPDTPD